MTRLVTRFPLGPAGPTDGGSVNAFNPLIHFPAQTKPFLRRGISGKDGVVLRQNVRAVSV